VCGLKGDKGELKADKGARARAWRVGMRLLVSASFFPGCASNAAAACRAPVQVVDQVDAGVALLVGPGPEDLTWSHDARLREGMVLSRGVPSEACRTHYRERTLALRSRLEQKFVTSE
jgi:hypothetical protein